MNSTEKPKTIFDEIEDIRRYITDLEKQNSYLIGKLSMYEKKEEK